MIPDSEIAECPDNEVESKIGNIFVNEKILDEYSVKIYEINSYFYTLDLIFEEKRQKALEQKLGCTFIRINTSK